MAKRLNLRVWVTWDTIRFDSVLCAQSLHRLGFIYYLISTNEGHWVCGSGSDWDSSQKNKATNEDEYAQTLML